MSADFCEDHVMRRLFVFSLAFVLSGCPCPSSLPPTSAQGSALLAQANRGIDAAEKACALEPCRSSVLHARARFAAIAAIDVGRVWCESTTLLDRLRAIVDALASVGAPIPVELVRAVDLASWAADHASCACSADAG